MFKLKKGFNKKCSNEIYHAEQEHRSSSALKKMLTDPREYHRLYVLGEKQDFKGDALAIGSYTHCRILEPELLDEEFTIWTGSRRSGKDWEKFKEENQGKTIITASQKALVDSMIAEYEQSTIVLGNHGAEKEVRISSFFEHGAAEETLAGTINDFKVKCRFDYRKIFTPKSGTGAATFGSINDLKTTGEALSRASRDDVEAICEKWGYDVSAALYCDMAFNETGIKHDFFFIFMSKKDLACRIFKASETMLERGRKKYKRAIALIKKAEETGIYFENKISELR